MKQFFFNTIAFVCFFNAIGQTNNQVLFQAKIENRNWDYVYIKDNDYKTIKIIKLNKEDLFQDTLTLNEGLYLMFDGAEYYKIYLAKGYDLHITMNADNFRETLVFSGIGAEINNFLVKESAIEVDYNYSPLSLANNKEINELINKKEVAAIQRLTTNTTFDPIFVALQMTEIKSHSAELKKYYGELREMN